MEEYSGKEIIARIQKDAEQKAEKIISNAQKSAELTIEDMRQKAHQNAQKKTSVLLKKAENDAEIIRGKVSTEIKRKAGWIVLSEKNRLISSVLDEVKKRLEKKQDSENYAKILENLIIDAGVVLGGGILEVILNQNDPKTIIDFDKLEKRISKLTGVQSKVKVSKKQTKNVGVIVKTIDGKVIVDNTFKSIINRRENELRLKISQIIF